ncbi:hypothetical protein [Psychrobacter sp. DM4]|uniref:hypothetical protein n=1 Tax=Psychrobacter sp. DM4 TaxID=3440637 RepID=UPI003F4F783B
MVAPRSTTRPATQSYRRQALMWLLMTLVLGVITALIWMFSQTPSMAGKIENAPISAPQALTNELEQPLAIEALHELDTDVQPINFDATIRDLRSYPEEFKDKRYLLSNKGKWTVQVMNVAENDVIVSYLEGRKDRDKFSYFRYRDEDDQLRYMLTYGLMSSPQEAAGAAKLIDFKLPANVRVLPEEINRYVSIIDNYERPGPIKDLSNKRARSVTLKRTKREVPPRQPTQTQNTNNNPAPISSARNQDAVKTTPTESIRDVENTASTLSVDEERTVGTEQTNNDKPKTEQSSTKPTSPNVITAPKKPPVVPTPKPPPATNNDTNTRTAPVSNNKAPAKSDDSIKALIEEKNNQDR